MPISGDRREFSEETIEKAPDKPGVYALYKGTSLIYIGRAQGGSSTIRTRLKDHMLGHEGSTTQKATFFRYEVSSSPAIRQRQLLLEYSDILKNLSQRH